MKNNKPKAGPPRREKKGVVIYAGLEKEGGSIEKVRSELDCKRDNVVMHISQCHENYGFDIEIKNDRFKIRGEIPAEWGW